MAPRGTSRRSIALPVRRSTGPTPGSRPASGASRTATPGGSTNNGTRNLLIIGIDYGTTFTSVSYSYVKDGHAANPTSLGVRLSSIDCVMKWQGTSETGYTPTTLLYSPTDDGPGPRSWGYKVAKSLDRKDVPEDAYEIRLAKLLLHEARETQLETIRLKDIAKAHGKEEIDFIRDFLRRLHDFLLGEDGYFQQHHSPWLVNTDIEFIIGVPAAWSEPEQQAMIQAAIEAGFENPSRGSEPEAMAAIYFAQHETSLEVGDTFVICDAGGGTVDLITYTVAELNPLRLNEASVAEGVLCGSTYLNQRLRNLLKNRLKDEHYLRDIEEILDQNTRTFDLDFKKVFDGTEGEFFSVPGLLEDSSKGFQEGRLWISPEELKSEVFDPIVKQIDTVIHNQIKSSRALAKEDNDVKTMLNTELRKLYQPLKIKNVVLGGGFASNKYLFNTLRNSLDVAPDDPEDRIEIQTLSPAGTTVAKGLVLMASRYGLVKQRRSRRSYGIRTFVEYTRKYGDRETCCPVEDEFDKTEFFEAVDWLVRKGQPLTQQMSFTRRRDENIGPDTSSLMERIITTDLETSTAEYTLMNSLPEGSYDVNQIISHISEIPKESYFRSSDRRKRGPPYYIVEWDVTLAIKHNEMIWRVILRPDKRPKIPLETTTLLLDAVESKNKILGSLASRWEKGPVKPVSQFPSPPMFSRKRTLEDGQGSRKSTRIASRRSDIPIPSIESRISEETEDISPTQ